MPRRIEEDRKDFIDIVSGRFRESLRKFANNGKIFKRPPKGGNRIAIPIPHLDIPRIVYGDNGKGSGVGRGQGKPGDVIKKGDQPGQGAGQAGDQEGEGMEISVDLEDIWDALQEQLKLPDLKPKPSQIFEEIKIKYNDIALTGPESLRHNARTLKQALKRQCATGQMDELVEIPGCATPMRLITPINSDKRYRQYKEIKLPASNAVIFFARDGSASMDEERCDIASDIAWWLDAWIRRFYKKVERCYIWHDVAAQEVDEKKFYNYRYGGGTTCSSAMKLISKQLENRYDPNKWNIYVFYFTDGENSYGDNPVFCDLIKEKLNHQIVNFVGITQILARGGFDTLKSYVDQNIGNLENICTTEVVSSGLWYELSDDDRAEQIRKVIMKLLGSHKINK